MGPRLQYQISRSRRGIACVQRPARAEVEAANNRIFGVAGREGARETGRAADRKLNFNVWQKAEEARQIRTIKKS